MELGFDRDIVGGQPRLLVIESNRNYLGVIARRLGEFGYRIATADSAQAGLAELHRVPADLLLCSAKLPGTSGIELVRMIREDPANRDLPVMLIVGRSDTANAVKAFEAGADGIVRKPCHFEVLAAAIARQLTRAEAVRQLIVDKAALDARVISRSIELGEVRDQLRAAESERRRLAGIVAGRAA
ncbi:MAG TPA: response regulator [Sphingomicrobium sp.]|nr:response regulator [Sphingomicrobium sp.]